MIGWLIIPAHAAILNIISFLIGLVGLIITFAGFAVAWKQLSKIKTETEATNAAVRLMQFKIVSLDVVKECHSAMARISEIRSALKKSGWEVMLSNYETLIEIFLKLAHSTDTVVEADRDLMIKMTQDMAKICDGLRRNIANTQEARPLRGQDQALRNFADVMTRIAFQSEKGLRV